MYVLATVARRATASARITTFARVADIRAVKASALSLPVGTCVAGARACDIRMAEAGIASSKMNGIGAAEAIGLVRVAEVGMFVRTAADDTMPVVMGGVVVAR